MRNDAGETRSVWMGHEDVPAPSSLLETMRADVCVVGAGITGLTTAILLAREGKSVVVVDDGAVGGGETGRTTAHLSNALDDYYFRLEEMRGADAARLAAASHTSAIDMIERIVEEERIDCGFDRVDGFLFLGRDAGREILDRELEAARRAGITGVERLDRLPGPSFDDGPCLRFPRQGQFNPARYLAGLAAAFMRDGGRVFTDTHVERVIEGRPRRVDTREGGEVLAESVVIATNAPVIDCVHADDKQEPRRTYAIAALVPPGSVVQALFWDTAEPYHYVRLARARIGPSGRRGVRPLEYDVLIVGGEDHKTGAPGAEEARFNRLVAWARERFPAIVRVIARWSGQVMEPRDGLALIGRNGEEPDMYLATGDSGHGMTHGTIAGMLLRDLILGRESPWKALYDPARSMPDPGSGPSKGGGGEAGGRTEDDIPRGEGAVVKHGSTKVAVYRDMQGVIARHSAACTHKGCTVSWNSIEKTWDCGCHGSRYDRFGRVVNGPANRDLKPGRR